EANIEAFRTGRRYVDDPTRFIDPAAQSAHGSRRGKEIALTVTCDPDSELGQLVALHVSELVAYQNEAYARSYASEVEHVRRTEAEVAPGGLTITAGFARSLFKLMAYKDEYEVARLSLDPD